MSQTTGFNQAAAQAALDVIIAGGADIRLMTTALEYGDTATELGNKEVSAANYSVQSVAETDWNVSFDSATNTATLTNANAIQYGETTEDWGVVVDIAIQDPTTDEFIIADEPNDPEITAGESVSFPAGSITYTLGAAQN